MRFGYTILYVRDVEASLAFYEQAFGLERRLLHDSRQYAELETGETALALASHDLAQANLADAFRPPHVDGAPTAFEVCLVTDNVDAGFSRAVEAGATAVSSPRAQPWGQRVAYVADPDGALIELASPAE